jgi:N-acetylmuramoyl-L-alanine amidase
VERLWHKGDSGPVVTEIRSTLTRLGLIDASDSDRFDQQVDLAIRAFQQQRGLKVDGMVGGQTYRALDEARWRLGDRVLRVESPRLMRGDDVAALQSRLLTMGFDVGRVDGILGPRTEAAVREFQQSVGLIADGVCGPDTFTALARLSRTITGGAAQALRERHILRIHAGSLSGRVIVIDPGHGGSDPGEVGNGVDEADIVFDLARRLEGRLAALGVTVFLTRSAERNPSEGQRAEFANDAGADLMVSLHMDSHITASASGIATYYYGHDAHGFDSPMGERFADLVQRELCARTGMTDCRIHPKTWELLRRTRMPAVRIDCGYITHPVDAQNMSQATFRDAVAEAIAIAIQRLYLPDDAEVRTGALRL